jgi:hypothetical protein
MVRRLVEEEQIGLGNQRAGEQDAPAPPPDSVSTIASAGRLRRESTSSTRCSMRQPSRSSSWC